MTLSEFINQCKAHELSEGEWEVNVVLKGGELLDITVHNCCSEYEAKERCYLALTDLIENYKP